MNEIDRKIYLLTQVELKASENSAPKKRAEIYDYRTVQYRIGPIVLCTAAESFSEHKILESWLGSLERHATVFRMALKADPTNKRWKSRLKKIEAEFTDLLERFPILQRNWSD